MSHEAPTPENFSMNVPMLETDPAIIDRQIEAGLAIQEAGGHPFLYNFWSKLPGSGTRNLVLQFNPERLVVKPGSDSVYLPLHSELAQRTTAREFFGCIDQAVIDAGLDFDQAKIYKAICQENPLTTDNTPEDMAHHQLQMTGIRYIMPAYRLLRQRGFSHFDLDS
jgi:hypothetical protein